MSSCFIWIMLIRMSLMIWSASRRQCAMQEEQRRRTEKDLVPGNWVRIIGGFYGVVVEVDGDVVTLAMPLGDETLQSRQAVVVIKESSLGFASAHGRFGSDVEQTDNDIQDSEQDMTGLQF